MEIFLPSEYRNVNGHAGFPMLSRKAFYRVLPRRVGAIEDALDAQARRVDELICRLATVEVKPQATTSDPALTARFDNLVAIVAKLAERVEHIDRRSLRSRRKVAAIADQITDQLT